MTGNELQPAADMANTYGTGTWDVFWAWVFTPTGAVIFLLMLGVVIATVVMKLMNRATRVLTVCASTLVVLFFLWVVGGILEAWGVPVREIIAALGSRLPDLGSSAMDLISRMFTVAG